MNSRKARRNKQGFKGEGNRGWSKVTEYGTLEKFTTDKQEYQKNIIAYAKHIGLYGKHIGSKAIYKIRRAVNKWNKYQAIINSTKV